jgi:hypothetical protein
MIYNISSILMWFFYAPSQVLIALSGDTLWQISQKTLKLLCKNM